MTLKEGGLITVEGQTRQLWESNKNLLIQEAHQSVLSRNQLMMNTGLIRAMKAGRLKEEAQD